MSKELVTKYQQAIWVCKTLFNRGKVHGSTGNVSFIHEGNIYITGYGTCSGTMTEEGFAIVNMKGEHVSGIEASNETELHKTLYQKDSNYQAIVHTHSTYATLWSCLPHENTNDVMPNHTPYLKRKIGAVSLVPYATPGTEKFFQAFRNAMCANKGYLMQNHGSIVADVSIMDAFYGLEELEETATLAWYLKDKKLALG